MKVDEAAPLTLALVVYASLIAMALVGNRDHRPMPFQFGFHPAFVWPLPDGTDRTASC